MELRDADIAGSMASVRRTGREFSFFFFFFQNKMEAFPTAIPLLFSPCRSSSLFAISCEIAASGIPVTVASAVAAPITGTWSAGIGRWRACFRTASLRRHRLRWIEMTLRVGVGSRGDDS